MTNTFFTQISLRAVAILIAVTMAASALFVTLPQQANAQAASASQAALMAQISQLVKLIAALQAQLAAAQPAAPTAITIGSRVETTDNLSVRINVGGERIGVVAAGVGGEVVGGPRTLDGRTWWEVNYENGLSGWSAGNWLRAVQSSSVTSQSYTLTTYGDQNVDAGDTERVATIAVPRSSQSRYLNNANIAVMDGRGHPSDVFEEIIIKTDRRTYRVDVSDDSDWTRTSFSNSRRGYTANLYNTGDNRGWGAIFDRDAQNIDVLVKTKDSSPRTSWSVFIPEDGVEIWDNNQGELVLGDADDWTDLNVYVEDEAEEASIDIEDEDMSTRTSSDGTVGEFVIEFDITAEDGDVQIVNYAYFTGAPGKDGVLMYYIEDEAGNRLKTSDLVEYSSVLDSTAEEQSSYYEIDEGDTESFELTVVMKPKEAGMYRVGLNSPAAFRTPDGSGGQERIRESDYRTDYEYLKQSGSTDADPSLVIEATLTELVSQMRISDADSSPSVEELAAQAIELAEQLGGKKEDDYKAEINAILQDKAPDPNPAPVAPTGIEMIINVEEYSATDADLVVGSNTYVFDSPDSYEQYRNGRSILINPGEYRQSDVSDTRDIENVEEFPGLIVIIDGDQVQVSHVGFTGNRERQKRISGTLTINGAIITDVNTQLFDDNDEVNVVNNQTIAFNSIAERGYDLLTFTVVPQQVQGASTSSYAEQLKQIQQMLESMLQ